MRFLFSLFLCLGAGLSLYSQSCNSGTQPKILLIGDSWANFMHLNQSIQAALNNHGFTDLGQLSDNNLTFAGARTTDILDSAKLADIETEILANPNLEFVHLSIGGNDILYTWDINYSQPAVDELLDTVFNRIVRIVDFIHSVNPDLMVVWSGYTFANFADVIGGVPSVLQSQHPYYSTWAGMGFPNFVQINSMLRLFSDRISTYADMHPKVHFIKALGLMQHRYGQNSPMSVPPTGTYAARTAPIDTGLLDYPSPAAAMISLGTIPFTGITLSDCFHLNANAYEAFMDYQFDSYYMQALLHDAQVHPDFGGTVSQSGQLSNSFLLGTLNQDENRMLLNFNYSLPDTGVSSASLFLKRRAIQNGNILGQATDINIDLFYQQSGSSPSLMSDDFNASALLSFSACTYGNLNDDGTWLRIDLPSSAAELLQSGQLQMRISAMGVTDRMMEFFDSADSTTAPILDLVYGPKVPTTLSVAEAENAQLSELNIYPNPAADGHFYLQTADAIQSVAVFTLDGRKLPVDFDKNQGLLQLQSPTPGFYMARLLLADGRVLVRKIACF